AAAALLFLGRRERLLKSSLSSGGRERARELAQLGAGLAHEIRNPLHALRINLHTLRRALTGRSPLASEDVVATIRESDASIDRLDVLMRDLLQFSDPHRGEAVEV